MKGAAFILLLVLLPAARAQSPAPAGDAPALKGLVFLSAPTEVQPQGLGTAGLSVEGVPLLQTAEFQTLATPYLGRPVSLAMLHQLTREIVLYCRRHDRPVVDVFVPEQNIQTGTVQILVLEGRLGRVRTEGTRWFSAAAISASVRLRPGEVITSRSLLDDLAWINRNPFRQVDLVYTRSQHPGETDLVLRTTDRRPLRFHTGYEDSGNALTGFDRALAGVDWGNVLGLDHELGYQLSASPDGRKFVAHSGRYTVPLPAWRHILALSGSYVESRPQLAGGLFTLQGRAWQIGARYLVPLPAAGGFTQDFAGGFDFKRSNNNLAFGGMQVFARETDVVQAVATYTAGGSDRFGSTTASLTLALSPGGLSAGNHTGVFREARSFARADYAYVRFEVERTTRLPTGFSWTVRGTGQLATANLLGSEQLGFGGADSLRGYEDHEAGGDEGFIFVNELHARPVRVARHLGFAATADRLDPLVFWDCGLVRNRGPLEGEAAHLAMSSAGVGLRYTFSHCLGVRAEYGWQLETSGVSDGRRSRRGHLSVTLAY